MINWWQKISTKHPLRVIIITAALLVIGAWYGFGVFGQLGETAVMNANSTESVKADKAIQAKFGATPNSQIILFTRNDKALGQADSPVFQAEVNRLVEPLKARAVSVMTYSTTGSANFISNDKSMAYAIVNMNGKSSDIYKTMTDFAKKADQSKLHVSIGGAAALIEEMNQSVARQLGVIEAISLPVLLVLLIFFFRSVAASIVPLGIALCTVIGAFAIARLLTHVIALDSYAINVITILGLGLSIDYALLSVNRFREELVGGVDQAVKKMIATSGHTIVFSGITVIACLLSLLVFPFDVMHSVAIGGASTVAMAVVTTYVVLPSVLKLIGHRIDAGSIVRRNHKPKPNRFWPRIAGLTTNHPVISLVVGLVIVILALLPVLKFQPGNMDYKWLARNTESQQVLQTVTVDFPSSTPDLTVVLITPKTSDTTKQIETACEMTKTLTDVKGVRSVISATPISPQLPCATINLLAKAGQLPASLQGLTKSYLRDSALKFDIFLNKTDMKGEEKVLLAVRNLNTSNGDLLVTGRVAQFYDSNQSYYHAAPWAAAIIAVCMIVLLGIALRSIVVPVQALVINSISLAVSLAAIVGVFQLGWFSSFTGWPHADGIVLAAPILVVAIAFGLAMDYSVFLYARMRETYDETGDSIEAVREGIIKTGPIITAAAVALFVVVIGFVSSSVLFLQIIGLGMAIAVIVDAFFVRLILVPAIMTLVGKHSWR